MSITAIASARQSEAFVNYILFSETTGNNLQDRLGQPEYSYFFVREAYRSMLNSRQAIHIVSNPELEVDAIYDQCRARGEQCIFLSFAPPHRSFVSLRCPTIPVFAWEFNTIPSEVWGEDPRNDWRTVLSKFGSAITHSKYSMQAVQAEMGGSFQIESIPAPIWDRVRRSARQCDANTLSTEIKVEHCIDTRVPRSLPSIEALEATPRPKPKTIKAKLRRSLAKRIETQKKDRLPEKTTIRFEENEVIYISVLNPYDGRKNWADMLSAFCISCKELSDATLVLKLIHHDHAKVLAAIGSHLARMPPFKCRVVAISDFLDKDSYTTLINMSKYVVNTSLGEGQCLPLMEGMSWGKPALAPQHSSMSEYVNESTGFVIDSSLEPCCWPHDPRAAVRTFRYRLNWESIAKAFRQSYHLIKEDQRSYIKLSLGAIEMQRNFCSEEVIVERLRAFVSKKLADRTANVETPNCLVA